MGIRMRPKSSAAWATTVGLFSFMYAAHVAAAELESKHWVPTVSFAIGSFDERLRLKIDDVDYDSYRGQLRTLLAIGLAHPVLHFSNEREWLDSHMSLGIGPTFLTGHWHVPLREDFSFAYSASSFTLRAGLGLGLTIDTTEGFRSFGEFALPIGLTLWRTVELVYRPLLAVPLGRRSTAVFGGERELETRFGIMPFELSLRLYIGALGW